MHKCLFFWPKESLQSTRKTFLEIEINLVYLDVFLCISERISLSLNVIIFFEALWFSRNLRRLPRTNSRKSVKKLINDWFSATRINRKVIFGKNKSFSCFFQCWRYLKFEKLLKFVNEKQLKSSFKVVD